MNQVSKKIDYASVSLEEASPPHTVGFSDARRALPALIKQVADTGVRAVITRYDKPAVAVVPLADLRRLEAWDAERAGELTFEKDVSADSLQKFMEIVEDEAGSDQASDEVLVECAAVVDHMLASMLAVPEMEARFQQVMASAIRDVASSTTKSPAVDLTAEALGTRLQQNVLAAFSSR